MFSRIVKTGISCWVGLFALVAFSAWPARGAVLLEETFDTPTAASYPGTLVDTVGGRGWRSDILGEDETRSDYLKFPAAERLRSAAGTLEMDLVRGNQAEAEALFALVDAEGVPLVVGTIYWNGLVQHQVPELQFGGEAPSGALWYVDLSDPVKHGSARVTAQSIPFSRTIRPGQRFRLTLTWGSRPDECAIYLDGQQLSALKDMPFGLGASIQEAQWLVIGAEPIPGTPGAGNQLHSPLLRVSAHDVALAPGSLPTDGLKVESVAAGSAVYRAGQDIEVVLRGTADKTARFTVSGLTADVSMEEVDDGVYVGRYGVPEGVNSEAAVLIGILVDPASGNTTQLPGAVLRLDSTPPQGVPAVLAHAPWGGEIEVGWNPSPSADVENYRIYRGEGTAPNPAADPFGETRDLTFVDRALLAGITYQYAVVAVDGAGNASGISDVVSATALAGEGPAVSEITVEPFGKPARPGETLIVRVVGQSGAGVNVALGNLVELALTEEGSSGLYSASYTVPEEAVASTRSLHRLVVTIADDFGSATVAGPELAIIGSDALDDTEAPVIQDSSHDGWQVAGFSGALVAGDTLTVTLDGEPNGYASFAIDGVTSGIEMVETPPGGGIYSGSYTVGWADQGTDLTVTASLADEAGNAAVTAVGKVISFDTRVRLTVTARDSLLPADQESQTRLVVKATDANGGEVSGHELSLTLSTTEEYTGVVGGGDVGGRRAAKDDDDDLEVKWGGTTDFGGEVAATYTAGFAAKTALIVAKDLTTGDVGAGWLNTYVASTVAITLTDVSPRAARGLADQAVLTLTADPAKLTADGRSRSRVTATLRDFAGNPIDNARLIFALAGDNGALRTLDNRTDANGVAQAEYRAGTLIGTVTVTAVSNDFGVTAAVQITLMSDAPAKIDLVADSVSLPADGRATAEIALRVTDIHDNPNAEVPVTLAVRAGSGELGTSQLLTDRNGEGRTTYTAGRTAGQAVIEARHTSRAPTEDELRRIYGTVFVPKLMERQERERIQVAEWLAEAGDEVSEGAPLVTLESRRARWTLTSPETGIFVRATKHRRDRVELGDTLGYVEIDPDVWVSRQ